MIDNLSIGQIIKKHRLERNETLHQAAKNTDIDMTMLSKLERSERFPTLEQIKRIAKYCNIIEKELIIKLTAEKILRKYGLNKTTYAAIQLVHEKLIPYAFNKKDNLNETED